MNNSTKKFNKVRVKLIIYLPLALMILTMLFIVTKTLRAGVHDQTQTGQQTQQVQQVATNASAAGTELKNQQSSSQGMKYLAVAIVVGASVLGAGIALSNIGSAGIGAISEKPELFGRVLTFIGLAEGLAIWGLIVGILILYG